MVSLRVVVIKMGTVSLALIVDLSRRAAACILPFGITEVVFSDFLVTVHAQVIDEDF